MSAPILERARATLDTTHLERVLSDLDARRRAVVTPDPTDTQRALVAEVVAGGALPPDLGARVLATRRAKDDAAAELAALRAVDQGVRAELVKRRRDGGETSLEVVAVEVAEIVGRAREAFAQLSPDVRSAEQAIAHDQVEAWREVVALAHAHDEAREAQRILTTAVLAGDEHDPDHVDPLIAAQVDVLGHVREPSKHVEVGVVLAGREANAKPSASHPWYALNPITGERDLRPELRGRVADPPWLDEHRVAALRFLARDDVEAFVPGARDLWKLAHKSSRWSPEAEEERLLEVSPRRAALVRAAAPAPPASGLARPLPGTTTVHLG